MNDRIDQYLKLIATRPELFRPVDAYPICIDRNTLIQFEQQTVQEVGLLVNNYPFTFTLGDVIIGKDGRLFRYVRVVAAHPEGAGSVVLPVWQSEDGEKYFGLLRNARHAPRLESMLELVRGHLEIGMDAKSSAVLELVEELGCNPDNIEEVRYLGQAHVDTGLTDALVNYFQIQICGPKPTGCIRHEGIHSVHWYTKQELFQALKSDKITDAFTHVALLKHILLSESK